MNYFVGVFGFKSICPSSEFSVLFSSESISHLSGHLEIIYIPTIVDRYNLWLHLCRCRISICCFRCFQTPSLQQKLVDACKYSILHFLSQLGLLNQCQLGQRLDALVIREFQSIFAHQILLRIFIDFFSYFWLIFLELVEHVCYLKILSISYVQYACHVGSWGQPTIMNPVN